MMVKVFKSAKSLMRVLLTRWVDKFYHSKKVSILMYHSIAVNSEFFTVTPSRFEKQMRYLATNGYRVISLATMREHLRTKEKFLPKTVVLTFDDGYEDNYLNAFPILKKYGFPATIFLVTGWVGNKDYVNKRGIGLPMLDWPQIKTMHDSGLVDFEPHTVTHPRLSSLSVAEIKDELLCSKIEIEKQLGSFCLFFASPYGNYNEEAIRAMKELFALALTVEPGWIDEFADPITLKRNAVDSGTGPLLFKLKV